MAEILRAFVSELFHMVGLFSSLFRKNLVNVKIIDNLSLVDYQHCLLWSEKKTHHIRVYSLLLIILFHQNMILMPIIFCQTQYNK